MQKNSILIGEALLRATKNPETIKYEAKSKTTLVATLDTHGIPLEASLLDKWASVVTEGACQNFTSMYYIDQHIYSKYKRDKVDNVYRIYKIENWIVKL